MIVMDKEFTGDDNHTTANGGAMKGLSPCYLMASIMTAEELEEAAH